MKKLTIIIPCYQMEKYVIKALESIAQQENHELFCDVIVIDDGSYDTSKEIVKDFILKNKLNNFKLIEKENGNWGSVINYAKNKCTINSQYITILDADDYYAPNLFKTLKKYVDFNYDLIFTGFFEIKKGNKITKGYLTPQKGDRLIDKKYMRFPSLIPLCKFFKTELFLKLDDLKEKVSYQDIILWNKFIDMASTFYYIKKEYSYYLNHREGASSTQAFDQNRIKILTNVIDELISNDVYTNGYLVALLFHLKLNTARENRKYIKLTNNPHRLSKFKLLWCPFGTRTITKIGILIYIGKIIKK